MTTGTNAARRLDGTATARRIRADVAAGCARLAGERGIVPGLTVVLVGDDPASRIYVRNKERSAREVGMRSAVVQLPGATAERAVLDTVRRLNDDPEVHGVLVQLPLPSSIDSQRIVEALDPRKDVDGLHPDNVGRLVLGLPGFVPCTPAGVIELLKDHAVALVGRHAVILGRSNIVGKPMALLLLREHCTVTVCHSRSEDLAAIAATADILVAAVGRRAMITAQLIKPGAAVVDVGIHRVEDEVTCRALYGDDAERLAAVHEKGATLVGDVHPLEARMRAGWLSPVPGGVGPLTIALLLRNALDAARGAAAPR